MQSVPENGSPFCSICMDHCETGETLNRYICGHTFHQVCADTWTAMRAADILAAVPDDEEPTEVVRCPMSREIFTSNGSRIHQAQPRTPSDQSFQSVTSAFPWWPTHDHPEFAGLYHALTQLTSGQVSMIIDPGAWTNLFGAKVARKLAARAVQHGHKPQQLPMTTPLNIQGVGNGSQPCNFKISTPAILAQNPN